MTIPSGSDTQHSDSPESPAAVTGVPLASLPLVAGHENTVATANSNPPDATDVTRSDVARESGNVSEILFGLNGSDSVPGTVMLGHFKVLRRIGAGGMGHVFLAEDIQLRRPVALKILKPSTANDAALLTRFQNEARCAAMLRPENIAQVYYIGVDQGLHFIACEYVSGRTVRELIVEEEVLPVDRVLNYAIQTTLALNHMHASGVIHRDIKPSNIIVSDDGRVKIVDLGLARRDSPDSVCDVTVAGSILGTFDYIAPEQARDPRQADIRSDLYSLGCTMYHMLTGQPPYPEGTVIQKVMDHQGKQAPDPAKINSRVPPALAQIVLTMLSTDPADRQQTPMELLADLTDLAADLGLQGVPADGVVWRDETGTTVRQQSGALAMLAAVCVVCATALAMHLMPNSSDPVRLDVGAVPDAPSNENPSDTENAEPLVKNEALSADTGPDAGVPDPTPSIRLPDLPFVVHTPGEDPESFRSLNEALEFARSADGTGHEIELDFTGVFNEPIQQLPRLEGETVHLFAADGARPVLEYHGNPDDPGQTSLFRLVNNSSLTIEGVALHLTPDPSAKDSRWSLFECVGPSHLALRDCSVQVDVGPRADAEVYRFNDSAVSADDARETTVTLTDVAVRGTTDMFRVASLTEAHFHLDNCGFAIDGHLFDNIGSTSMNPRGSLNIDMQHVTAITGRSVFRIVEDENPSRRTTAGMQITSDACVFSSAFGNGVLVDSQGPGRPRDLQDLLNWSGHTNLYSGFDNFWILDSKQFDVPSIFTFSDWTSHWNRRQTASEENPFPFVWSESRWLVESADETDLRLFQTDWFEIDPTRFHSSPTDLPLAEDRTPPGVVVRRLPEL